MKEAALSPRRAIRGLLQRHTLSPRNGEVCRRLRALARLSRSRPLLLENLIDAHLGNFKLYSEIIDVITVGSLKNLCISQCQIDLVSSWKVEASPSESEGDRPDCSYGACVRVIGNSSALFQRVAYDLEQFHQGIGPLPRCKFGNRRLQSFLLQHHA